MPKDNTIQKVLVIGSGPIVIGQAAEFDYSGTQACEAIKQEGIEVVLVNSNPATIMTDRGMADETYLEPLTVEFVEKVIAKERPDCIIAGMGGLTGLCLAAAVRVRCRRLLRRDSGLEDTPFFYLRGGYAPDKVRGLDRVLMAAMKRHLAGKSDPQSQAALAAMRQGADWVSGDQLAPVLAWLAGRGGD